jgi:hypothetical protein
MNRRWNAFSLWLILTYSLSGLLCIISLFLILLGCIIVLPNFMRFLIRGNLNVAANFNELMNFHLDLVTFS